MAYSVHEDYSDFVDYFFIWRASLHIFYGLQVLGPIYLFCTITSYLYL